LNAPGDSKTAVEAHPAADVFPLMDDVRLQELADDIALNGLREPIQVYRGKVLDGRNRLAACEIAGVAPRFEHLPDDVSPWRMAWSLNGQRRDLSTDQRYLLWKECADADAEWQAEQDKAREEANRRRAEAANTRERKPDGTLAASAPTTCGRTGQDDAPAKPSRGSTNAGASRKAKAANVDRGTVERNEYLAKNRPDLLDKVKAGELTSSRAVTQARKEAKRAELSDMAAREVKAAHGVYDVIVMDPPWPMEKVERDCRPNQAAFDYPTMTEEELAAMKLPMADDCHVWVWTTHKFMPMALRLLGEWRLKYVCTFVWHKPGGIQPYNLPQYNCEFAIYARKGAPQFVDAKAFNTCFAAPRGAHSEKPAEFYEMVARVTEGRRLDMFNRRSIAGFDGWGNEAA
jgi:N6-adenosine-specific RNA methylase IME4